VVRAAMVVPVQVVGEPALHFGHVVKGVLVEEFLLDVAVETLNIPPRIRLSSTYLNIWWSPCRSIRWSANPWTCTAAFEREMVETMLTCGTPTAAAFGSLSSGLTWH